MIGTPFSSDCCVKCECWPCRCGEEPVNGLTEQEIERLFEKWKSERDERLKLSKSSIIPSKEMWDKLVETEREKRQ